MLEIVGRTDQLLKARDQHVPRGVLTAHPLVLERAVGAEVWDVEGPPPRRLGELAAGASTASTPTP